MGGIDSKFLIEAASEVVEEIKNMGWFDQIKSALTRSKECHPPGNDRAGVKSFIRCCANNASDTLEDRFLIVTLILMIFVAHILLKFGLKIRDMMRWHLDRASFNNVSERNENNSISMTMMQAGNSEKTVVAPLRGIRRNSRPRETRFLPDNFNDL